MVLVAPTIKEPYEISLIATFYNAEGYLDRCVRSLLQQTHDDYEVVLVDDGSNDGTWQRLLGYADGERVRCYTKSNGGAGSARNYGVGKARGRYVSFVDGDDFVSPYYLESLDLARIEFSCEHVVGTHFIVSENQLSSVQWSDEYKAARIAKDEAIEMLAYEELTESPCARLVPRSSYLEIPFPERYYEDVAVAGERFVSLGDVAVSHVPAYAYVMRRGSVVHREHASIAQLEDFVWAIDRFMQPLEINYPELTSALAFRRSLEYVRAHTLAVHVIDHPERAKAIDSELLCAIRCCLKLIRDDERVGWNQKKRFELLARHSRVYDCFFSVYERFCKTGDFR